MEDKIDKDREFFNLFRNNGVRFYKLLNEEEEHFGFKYKTGLNVDTLPFNPNGKCEPGGLYFIPEFMLPATMYELHFRCGFKFEKIREVIGVPEDANIKYEANRYYFKFKADKIILGESKPLYTYTEGISQHINFENYNTAYACMKSCGLFLRYVPHYIQNNRLCLVAVDSGGYDAYKYISKNVKFSIKERLLLYYYIIRIKGSLYEVGYLQTIKNIYLH